MSALISIVIVTDGASTLVDVYVNNVSLIDALFLQEIKSKWIEPPAFNYSDDVDSTTLFDEGALDNIIVSSVLAVVYAAMLAFISSPISILNC